MLERLEPRRLLNRDLYVVEPTLDGRVVPGEPALLTATIYNTGPLLVTQSFFLEAKLVKSASWGPVNTDFYDPSAIVLWKAQIDNDVPVGGGGFSFSQLLIFPQQLDAGRYSVVVGIDSELAVAETNESNNYFFFDPTRILSGDETLIVEGTAGDDVFNLTQSSIATGEPRYTLNVNGVVEVFEPEDLAGFDLRGLGGNDLFLSAGNIPNYRIDGGDGNDKILGGNLNDFLVGGAGKDQIFGNGGNDRLNGNGGNDKLFGGFGADRLYGYAGQDYLDGGSSGDRLDGGLGLDTLLGQSGVDRFFAADGEIDNVFGGSARDSATVDADDVLASIEVVTTV